MYLRSELHFVIFAGISALKRCSVRLYLHLFVGRLMSYLCYLCLFPHSDVGHILCCVFLRLMYPMLPHYLDFPFFDCPSVFSNVYCFTPVMFQLWKNILMSALSIILIIYSTYITSNKGSLSPFIFSRPLNINIDRIRAYYTLLSRKHMLLYFSHCFFYENNITSYIV